MIGRPLASLHFSHVEIAMKPCSPQPSASASLRAVKKKSKRKGRSDRDHWFFFRGGEPAHRIGSRSETQLLTACGLHFHPLTATPMQQGCNGPKCQTCVRARP